MNTAQYLDYYGPMKPLEAMSAGIYVAYALDFVWANYMVIHRDVKPQNILVDKEGYVKVCDFGLVTAHETAVVDTSAVEGTPYYLSPESVTQDAYQDNRSDIYALGATLFHLIVGAPPFDYDSLPEVVNARLTEDPPDVRDSRPDVDENVAMVIITMMARDPDDRYVTAYECLEDMERAKAGRRPVLVDKSREKVNK